MVLKDICDIDGYGRRLHQRSKEAGNRSQAYNNGGENPVAEKTSVDGSKSGTRFPFITYQVNMDCRQHYYRTKRIERKKDRESQKVKKSSQPLVATYPRLCSHHFGNDTQGFYSKISATSPSHLQKEKEI
jgi:hypothetical protein